MKCFKCDKEVKYDYPKPLCADHYEKCSRCDKAAEYDHPDILCGEHWAEWWATDDNEVVDLDLFNLVMKSVMETREKD